MSGAPRSATKAEPSPDGTKRHAGSHRSPANRPTAANARQRCGPESPIAMGSGGVSSATARNTVSQRAGAHLTTRDDGPRDGHAEPERRSAIPEGGGGGGDGQHPSHKHREPARGGG